MVWPLQIQGASVLDARGNGTGDGSGGHVRNKCIISIRYQHSIGSEITSDY